MNTLIELRAKYLKLTRQFFDDRGYLEIDAPFLSKTVVVDTYIDPIETKENWFLHTSPEAHMKKLLSKTDLDIYFLGHVFRKEEVGSRHTEEFMMAEWYRKNTTEEKFIKEICDFISIFIGTSACETFSYDDIYPNDEKQNYKNDEERHFVWATKVEPLLGLGKITIITDFLEEDSALAQTHIVDGERRSRRFEFYVEGMEVANCFHELDNADEQLKRFTLANEKRVTLKKEKLPMDEELIRSLKNGQLKNTYGVAAGFDRLLMLALKKAHINEISHSAQS